MSSNNAVLGSAAGQSCSVRLVPPAPVDVCRLNFTNAYEHMHDAAPCRLVHQVIDLPSRAIATSDGSPRLSSTGVTLRLASSAAVDVLSVIGGLKFSPILPTNQKGHIETAVQPRTVTFVEKIRNSSGGRSAFQNRRRIRARNGSDGQLGCDAANSGPPGFVAWFDSNPKRAVVSIIAIVLSCKYLLSAGGIALAEQTVDLRVSAIVPPRACTFPESCNLPGANVSTKLIVDNGVIRYVGTPPKVSRNNGLMTILF